jgi:hypothetical protein
MSDIQIDRLLGIAENFSNGLLILGGVWLLLQFWKWFSENAQ